MYNEKVILYGMGSHARAILSEYSVPIQCIKGVIDNSPENVRPFLERSGIEVTTWDEFVKKDKHYKGKIVISSLLYRTEIEAKILGSGLFQRDQIIYIDDWCEKFFTNESIGNILKHNEYKHLKKVMQMREDALKNTKVLSSRNIALTLLPQNLITAEIGVAYGDFSEKIVEIMRPKKFYGVDIFEGHRKGLWGDKRFEELGMNHLQWYQNRFCNEIESGIVEVREGISWDVLEEFPDAYFDYVYLDAAHNYDSVLRDVSVLKRKVKNGGIIQFNDYIIYDYVSNQFYGVVQVVNQLINETKSEVLYYCMSTNGFDDIVIKYLT